MSDSDLYIKKQQEGLLEYEERCKRCGECCGASGTDPCANLVKQEDSRYHCTVYADRMGPQKSVSGNVFTCVRIRDVHKHDVFYHGCAYNG